MEKIKLRCIIIELFKTGEIKKKKLLKAARVERNVMDRGTKSELEWPFLWKQ